MIYADTIVYKTASELNTAMAGVYKNMGIAVLISMLVSLFVGTSPELLQFFFTGFTKWVVIFAPLVAVIGITIALNANPPKSIAQLLLFLFAGLMGLSFATIFAAFKMGSIVTAFMGGAILFGVMSIYGYFTKQSLDSWGKFFFVGLIAVVIASIVNLFLGSSVLQMVVSAIAIIVFTGLTAYDTQKIREMLSVETNNNSIEITGALTLYLDFINIFLSLLQLFGERK